MTRRQFITLLGGAAFGWPLSGRAQQSSGLRRIGFLRAAAPPEHELDAFLRGLTERSYVQGRNFTLVPQWGEGNVAQISELAQTLVNQAVDIIVTEGGFAVRAAAAATRNIPIVMTSAAAPFLGGLIKNLSRPGGNVTGFASMEKDVSSKVFAIIKEMVPGLRRIGVIAARTVWPVFVQDQDQAAKALGIEYNYFDMPEPETVRSAMRQAVDAGAQGAVVRGSPYFSSAQKRLIIDSAAEHRLPTIYERRDDAERGGLVSYAPNVQEQYRATAEYVVRILAGEYPGDLPIQQPSRFEMVVNMKTAKGLGLEVPLHFQQLADEVIE